MSKKYYGILLILLSFFCLKDVYAFDSESYKYRSICENYEIAKAYADGTLEQKGCYSTYASAFSYMRSYPTEDLVMLIKNGGVTKIIDANLGVVDLTINPELLTYYYLNLDSKSAYTYMDNGSLYGGVDAILLDSDYSNTHSSWMAKVKIANFVGWIKLSTYEIVPLSWVKSSSYYTVTATDIRHINVKKIQNVATSTMGRNIGPKPDMLSIGTYYSFDGHYFYKDLKTLIVDNRNGTYENSVNKGNPYYNYYMYLSNHTRTSYSSLNIDEYIRNNLGFKENVYGSAAGSGASRLYGEGTFFYYAQEKYGVNAVLSLSLSRNETGNGRSNLSINKNNGFGLNAVDSNPTQAANWYASFSSSILGYASKWITYGYAHPRDWRYFGPQFGDKVSGMNVKYASDPYWSEKMAANYYALDKAFGLQDYNYYQLGVVKYSIPAYYEPSTSSKVIYNYTEKEDAVVIVEEITRNNEKWYKVVSDINLDANGNEIYSGDYNWNSYVYVKASDIIKTNTAKNGPVSPNSIFEYEEKDYEYDLCVVNAELKPKTAITLKNSPYYYDSTLSSKTGKTVLKDRYVMVYSVAYKDKIPVAYLITSDYWHDQKHWVSSDSIKLVTMNYGKMSVTTSDNQYAWVNSSTVRDSNTIISGLYTNSYVPILETVEKSGTIWYKVPVNLTGNSNIYGYTLASSTNVNITTYKYYSGNNNPIISAKDQTLIVNDSFNPLEGVSATDAEDGDLTSKIEISENTVNTSKAGEYKVTYKVKDSNDNEVLKTIKVTIKENEAPIIQANDLRIKVGETFDPKKNVVATDKEDGDLTSKIKVTKNEVDTSKEGIYKVIYSVTDSRNKTTKKEIMVTVFEKKEITEENLDISQYEQKESIFYFDYLKEVEKELQIKGYNAIKGINNTLDTEIVYFLEFESLDTGKQYKQKIERITNKEEITRPVNSTDKEDYTYSWFKGNINLKEIPDGDYKISILSVSDNFYYSKSLISNKVLKPQASSYSGTKSVTTRSNYLDKNIELELIIRSEDISKKTATSTYNMYNQYRVLEFKENQLHIKGTSYSYGMNLSTKATVERKIIFEDTTSYKKYTFSLGSITDGLYKVGTTLNDNLEKDRAWYDTEIDLKDLPKGNYAIYISTVSNISDYSELNDILEKDISKVTANINNKNYSFTVNKNKRYRIELNVK